MFKNIVWKALNKTNQQTNQVLTSDNFDKDA